MSVYAAPREGGKLSFDRYVMGAVFQEILELANQRLNIMSGGKYELIHQTGAGRRNAKAGLEVEVLDMATGRQRSSSACAICSPRTEMSVYTAPRVCSASAHMRWA